MESFTNAHLKDVLFHLCLVSFVQNTRLQDALNETKSQLDSSQAEVMRLMGLKAAVENELATLKGSHKSEVCVMFIASTRESFHRLCVPSPYGAANVMCA